ncbi:MAG: helix-hairpin-helix domain-containing protein, partial [Bacteroidales bacterium]|nr:helix-hairpin-helix domain-containing protein [Bacteroidales bacterium]
MRRWIFVLLCILCGRLNLCYAQKVFDPERILQGRIENMEEGLGEEVFDDLLDNPLRINEVTLSRLEEFPLFTRFMAASLYDYIKRNGAVLSLYELSAVPGFNKEVAEALAPFLDLSEKRRLRIGELSKMLKGGRSQLLIRGSAYT